MKRLAHTMILGGVLSIPGGYALFPVARRISAIGLLDGVLPMTSPAAGFWIVVAGYFAALFLLASGLIVLRLANRPNANTGAQQEDGEER